MRERDSIATIHNIFFTILTISVLLPKAVLAYEGQSALPNSVDLAYGVFVALLFFWLGEYRRRFPERSGWYFHKNIILVTREFAVVVMYACQRAGYQFHALAFSLRQSQNLQLRRGQEILTVTTPFPVHRNNISDIEANLNPYAQCQPSASNQPMLPVHGESIQHSTSRIRNETCTGSLQDWESWLMHNTRHGPLTNRLGYSAPTERPFSSSIHNYPELHAQTESFVKRKRKRADQWQLKALNDVYARTAFPSTEERRELAKKLDMSPRGVQIWFQNKRDSTRKSLRLNNQPLPSLYFRDPELRGQGEPWRRDRENSQTASPVVPF
ncbi:hypothetical protein BD410DRAFT_793362 [Rickenella mellea]|uniref:Homeobox domain-containing protein n=1 Tax=Rickenella mellea TaxID=50990 RepID=A0A4Y7PSG1_9AGAM|nr:hypothetical protein BD410DRAFT_793362 [Rickenella mellea]